MIDMVWKYMVKANMNPFGICDLYLKLPMADVSLAWLPWTVLAFIIGWLVYRNTKVNKRELLCSEVTQGLIQMDVCNRYACMHRYISIIYGGASPAGIGVQDLEEKIKQRNVGERRKNVNEKSIGRFKSN